MYRKIREGHFSHIAGLQELARTVDVSKVGVKGAAKFFESHIEAQSAASSAEAEIKAEQARKKEEREAAAKRKSEFQARLAKFNR